MGAKIYNSHKDVSRSMRSWCDQGDAVFAERIGVQRFEDDPYPSRFISSSPKALPTFRV